MVCAEAGWFLTCTLFDVEYGTAAVLSAAVFSILPDADYPKSWVGYQLGGLSEWLNARFGHRSFLHSLLALTGVVLLLYALSKPTVGSWWVAGIVGYASHLMSDMMTVGGVRLFWPNRIIAVFPGRDEYRVISGAGSERIFLVICLCAALVLYPLSQLGLERMLYGLRSGEELYVPVDEVIDGDTAEVEFGGQPRTVRFIGVDTPETVDPNRPRGCYGAEASEFTKESLEGQTVRLALPSLGDARDAYNRTLVYVYFDVDGNGEDDLFNLLLLRRGYAKTTTFDHQFRREFGNAEVEAAEQGAGLWGACPDEEPVSSRGLF